MGTTSENVETIETPPLRKEKSRSTSRISQTSFNMVHFLMTAKRSKPTQSPTPPEPLTHGARKDKYGQVYVPVGIYYRKIGERSLALYRCSPHPHRVKVDTRPNPFRSIQTTYKGLSKKQKKSIDDANNRRLTPIPIYKEYRYWEFSKVLPAPKRKRSRPISFETFLQTLERKRKGYTELQSQIVTEAKFLIQTNFRYCDAYLRPDPEGNGNDYGRPPYESIFLYELTRALCETYRSSYQTPDQYERFFSIVTSILRTHPKVKIWLIYVSLGVGELTSWPDLNPLTPMISISERPIPQVRYAQYEQKNWEYIETTFPGTDPTYLVPIETVQLISKSEEDDEEEDNTEADT